MVLLHGLISHIHSLLHTSSAIPTNQCPSSLDSPSIGELLFAHYQAYDINKAEGAHAEGEPVVQWEKKNSSSSDYQVPICSVLKKKPHSD
ncbi:hypothetical protein L1887_37792 [Cichorium endivia]|nr:hypothetical protein L1887_37792 [Cichorium endivia]